MNLPMKVILTVTITNPEEWAVDWTKESEVKESLTELDKDIRNSIADGCCIDFNAIKVESKFEN